MRFVLLAAAVSALASAVFLYRVSYDARRLESQVRAEEHAVATARAAIAVLRAERAHLARPERIEPLARKMGLAPIAASQIIRTMSAGDAIHEAQP